METRINLQMETRLKRGDKPATARQFTTLAPLMGLRLREAVALRWSDTDGSPERMLRPARWLCRFALAGACEKSGGGRCR